MANTSSCSNGYIPLIKNIIVMLNKDITCRRDIVEKAIIECLDEMYRESQPSITWDEIQELARVNPNRSIWQEHYLPQWKYKDIQEKYMRLYRIKEEWNGNIELLEEYLNKGGTKDKYIPEQIDESGFKHPGYRGYESVKPIKEQILEVLNETLEVGNRTEILCDKITNVVFETITACKEFYKHDKDEQMFYFNVANYSPNSNIEAVREYYKDTDVIINDIKEEDEFEWEDCDECECDE
jgi:hypothetical protein